MHEDPQPSVPSARPQHALAAAFERGVRSARRLLRQAPDAPAVPATNPDTDRNTDARPYPHVNGRTYTHTHLYGPDRDTYTDGHRDGHAYVHTHPIADSEYHPITHALAHGNDDTAFGRVLRRAGGGRPDDQPEQSGVRSGQGER